MLHSVDVRLLWVNSVNQSVVHTRRYTLTQYTREEKKQKRRQFPQRTQKNCNWIYWRVQSFIRHKFQANHHNKHTRRQSLYPLFYYHYGAFLFLLYCTSLHVLCCRYLFIYLFNTRKHPSAPQNKWYLYLISLIIIFIVFKCLPFVLVEPIELHLYMMRMMPTMTVILICRG